MAKQLLYEANRVAPRVYFASAAALLATVDVDLAVDLT